VILYFNSLVLYHLEFRNLLNQISKIIEQRFRQETDGIMEIVWLTIVDSSNLTQKVISNQQPSAKEDKPIKITSLKMAKTSSNLLLPSGFELYNGQLIRVTLSPKSDCEKHETVALGGMPIMTKKSKCIGGLGIAGLDGVENLRIAQAILPSNLLYFNPTWREALLKACEFAYV
jgi:hypothetical protein